VDFNSQYLLDILGGEVVLKSDKVEMRLGDSGSPALIQGDAPSGQKGKIGLLNQRLNIFKPD